MIKLTYKKFSLIPTVEYYYGYDNTEYGFFDIVTISQLHNKINSKCFKESIFHTGITDLSQDLSTIFNSFSKTNRNEIRRAEKEGIVYSIIKEPNKDNLLQYLEFYNHFLKTKHLPTISSNNLLKYMGNVYITYSKLDDEILSYHIYLYDFSIKKVRLLHSCSLFREKGQTKEFVNLVSYANKGLHYWDLNCFKNEGFIEYDRGGLYLGETDKQKINIDKFKLSFSPIIVEHYNYEKIPLILNLLYKIKLYLGRIF